MLRRRGKARNNEMYRQIMGTAVCVAAYRFLSSIPLPFADSGKLYEAVSGSAFMGSLDMLTGGNMSGMSIAAMGISPYISASIAVQLAGVMLPSISEMQRDGMTGRKKIKRLTFVLSIFMSVLSGMAMGLNYVRMGILPADPAYAMPVSVLYMAGASLALTSLGMYIDDNLFGNGISVFLAAGILASLPNQVVSAFRAARSSYGVLRGAVGVATLVSVMLVVWFVVFRVLRTSLDIQLEYSGKPATASDLSSVSVLPVKPLCGSVMPVIFASYFLAIPSMIRAFMGIDHGILLIFDSSLWFDMKRIWPTAGVIVYFALILVFGRVSQMIYVNEVELADALRRSGAVIPGVSPGSDTEVYLRVRVRTVCDYGSRMLCAVAILPQLVGRLAGVGSVPFVGTSLILVASVAYELYREFSIRRNSLSYEACMAAMSAGRQGGDPYALLKKARS